MESCTLGKGLHGLWPNGYCIAVLLRCSKSAYRRVVVASTLPARQPDAGVRLTPEAVFREGGRLYVCTYGKNGAQKTLCTYVVELLRTYVFRFRIAGKTGEIGVLRSGLTRHPKPRGCARWTQQRQVQQVHELV